MKKLHICLLWISIFFLTHCIAIKLRKLGKNNSNLWIWNTSEAKFTQLYPGNDFSRHVNAFSSMENPVIQVLANNMDPYIRSRPNSSFIDGFLGDMWTILEGVLGFKSNITAIEEFSQGRDMIKRNEADVYLAALVYTNKTTNMYFSQPYFRNWYHLYFKLPEGKPATYLHFEAFNGRLWAYLFMVFFLLTVCLWLTNIVLRTLVPQTEVLLSLPTCFMGVISSFLNTGYDLKLRSCTARFQIFIAFVFGVLCYYALSASLVASLAVLDRPMPFRTLEDLAHQKTYGLCMRNITFVFDDFTDSNATILPKWKDIVNTGKCPPNILNWTNIPGGICQGNAVILENRIIMGLALEHVQCPVTMLSQRFFHSGNYIVMSKTFKKRKALSIMMLRIWSTGIAQKLESKWVKSEVPTVPSITQADQITLSHIQGLALIYFASIGISLFLLLVEICFTKMSSDAGPMNVDEEETKFSTYKGKIAYFK